MFTNNLIPTESERDDRERSQRSIRRDSGGDKIIEEGIHGADESLEGVFIEDKDSAASTSSITDCARNAASSRSKTYRNSSIRKIARFDPTKTTTLRRFFELNARKRLNLVKSRVQDLVVRKDAFGITGVHGAYALLKVSEQIVEFEKWVEFQIDLLFISEAWDPWWEELTEKVFQTAGGRVFTDVEGLAALISNSSSIIRKLQFLKTFMKRNRVVDKIRVLVGRVLSELKDVKNFLVTRLSRDVADGLESKWKPSQFKTEINKTVDAAIKKSHVKIQTEITRIYAGAQLEALRDLNIDKVQIMVEFITAGDDRVCPECNARAGEIMTLEEAEGLIPLHPLCRCAFIPVGRIP